MRIMLVSPLPPPSGGIAAWTQRYMEVGHLWGLQVHIVNTAVQGKRATNFTERVGVMSEIGRTLNIFRDILVLSRKEKPQIMHVNSSCSPMGIVRDWLCMMLVSKKCAKVLHCRCTTKHQLGNSFLGNLFFSLAVRKADCVLVLNDESMQHVEGVRHGVVRKLPNFIDNSFLKADDKFIADNIRSVLFTGHVKKTKGMDELVAIAKMHPDIEFRIAGILSEDYPVINEVENIRYLGDVAHTEILRMLDEADVFLFPSYTEGFSNSLLEAMARGVPVIATDVGANREMVDNQGGAIVPPMDVESISAALGMLESRDLRSSMSDWNRLKVRTCYSVNSVMAQLVSIYQSLIGNSDMM